MVPAKNLWLCLIYGPECQKTNLSITLIFLLITKKYKANIQIQKMQKIPKMQKTTGRLRGHPFNRLARSDKFFEPPFPFCTYVCI